VSPQEINKAVAEEGGWRGVFSRANSYDDGKHLRGTDPKGEPLRIVPNFFADLNACREVEQQGLRTDAEKESFARFLFVIRGGDLMRPWPKDARQWFIVSQATAPEHCEAFLRVKGKWIE
jgi:hypothetical protein